MGISKKIAIEESKELEERIRKQKEKEEENYLINKIKREVKYNKKHIW